MKNQDLITYYDINEPIEVLGLSSRVYNKLKNEEFDIVKDIIDSYYDGFIFTIDNFGEKSRDEVKRCLLEKCNITIWNYNVNDFRNLNLSSNEIFDVVYKLHIKSVDSLLKISYENLEQSKYSDNIIKKIHSLGYIFDFEKNQGITLTTKIYDTPIYQASRRIGYLTIEELLKKSLNPKNRNSLYRIRDVGPIKAKKIIDIVHSYGFVFEDEKEIENKEESIEENPIRKQLTANDSIYDLNYYPILTRKIASYGINTIEDLLSLSTDKNINHNDRGIYSIRGLGEYKVNELMNYLHSLGFIFADERTNLDSNMTLDYLFNSMDLEYVSREFYEKINTPEEIEDNNFVIYFTKMANSICKNEFDTSYTNKEIITFLINKLVEHKKKLLNISNSINSDLSTKKYVRKQ